MENSTALRARCLHLASEKVGSPKKSWPLVHGHPKRQRTYCICWVTSRRAVPARNAAVPPAETALQRRFEPLSCRWAATLNSREASPTIMFHSFSFIVYHVRSAETSAPLPCHHQPWLEGTSLRLALTSFLHLKIKVQNTCVSFIFFHFLFISLFLCPFSRLCSLRRKLQLLLQPFQLLCAPRGDAVGPEPRQRSKSQVSPA